MSEEELLNYAGSMYSERILYAVTSPNATVNVLEKVLSNRRVNTVVLIKVLESPTLNRELFNKVFDISINNRYIDNIKKNIMSHPFFTSDMYNYYLDCSLSVDECKLLIDSKYASSEAYLKIIDSCYIKNDTFFEYIINGTYFNTEVLKKVIKFVEQNDKILCMCLDNFFINEEILSQIIDCCSNYFSRLPLTVKKTITHKYLTKELLIKIVDKYKNGIEKYKQDILDNPLCDSDVLKIMGKYINILEDVLKHKNITSDILVYFLDLYNDKSTIFKIINSSVADENVLIKTVNVLSNKNYNDIMAVIKEILINPMVTEKVLIEIVNVLKNSEINSLILVHPLVSKNIKIDIYLNENRLTDEKIDEFFNIENLTEDDIISFVNSKFMHKKVLEKAKEFPNATQKLFRTIILAIYDNNIKMGDFIIEMLDMDLDETTLVMIAKRTQNINILKKILQHKNAGLKIVAVINVVSDKFTNEQPELIKMATDLKQKIISQIYEIEKEENVTEILRRNVQERMSTMLWGPSGVGKTSRVFEVDPTATLLILKNGMLPEEVIGGKEPNGEPGEIYPPHWYNVLCEKCESEPDRMHILFIDEFTNVSDTIKNLVWEVIGNRLVNGHEEWPLPENCSIVVAGNRPEESSAVRIDSIGGVMPAPLHNRINSMLEIQFDIDEWQKWALETDANTGRLRIHPIVYSFCVAHADEVMFTQFDPEKITQAFLSPRKWETLSNALYSAEERGKNHHISNARIASILGAPEIVNSFICHYERLPLDIDKIIKAEYIEEDFPTIEDKLYALGTVIAEYDDDEIAVESFISDCLGDEYLSIYTNMKKLRNSIIIDNNIINRKK